MIRYITAARADQLRREAVAQFDPYALPPVHRLRGVIGVKAGDEYYVVADDDPRLQGQTPDPLAGA